MLGCTELDGGLVFRSGRYLVEQVVGETQCGVLQCQRIDIAKLPFQPGAHVSHQSETGVG